MTTTPCQAEADLPAPGTVVLFPLARHPAELWGAALVVQRVTAPDPTKSSLRRTVVTSRVLVVASTWVGAAGQVPADDAVHQRQLLSHHAWEDEPNMLWINEPLPDWARAIGHIALHPDECTMLCAGFGNWDRLPAQMLTQWRWDHERDALLQTDAEEAARRLAEEAARRLAHAHAQSRAPTLDVAACLEALVLCEWFASWQDDWETQLRQAAQAQLQQLVQAALALPRSARSGKPAKPALRRLLRDCVLALNHIDETSRADGGGVQTTHSEDLMDALARVAEAAGHPALADELDDWRDW